MGDSVFSGCSNLASVEMSNNISNIGSFAFQNCHNLIGITIPDQVEIVSEGMFLDCWHLSYIDLPANLSSIEDLAFLRCNELTSIVIPEKTKHIGNYVFGRNLKAIDFLGDAPIIEDNALSGLESSRDQHGFSISAIAYYPAGNATYTDKVKKDYGGISMWSGEKAPKIEPLMWSIDDGVLSVSGTIIPNYDEIRGYDGSASYLWKDGYNSHTAPSWFYHRNVVESIVIEPGVQYIGTKAFKYMGMPSISKGDDPMSVTIPRSVKSIGNLAFDNCSLVTDVYYSGSEDEWDEITGDKDGLKNATIHFNWVNSKEFNSTVHILSSYNYEIGKVRFDETSTHIGLDYALSAEIDQSAISSMLNKYVLAEIDTDSHTVTNLKPVESKIGTISAIDKNNSTISIDGEEYPLSKDNSILTMFADQQIGNTVLFHTYNGTVVALNSIEEKTGKLESWDYTAQELTIDGKAYPTNFLTDITFLANVDELFGKNVTYTYVNGDYSSIVSVELWETNQPNEDEPQKVKTLNLTIDPWCSDAKSFKVLINWTFDYFNEDSDNYDIELSKIGLVLSAYAEQDSPEKVEGLLESLGYGEIVSYNYDDFTGGQQFLAPAVTFGHAKWHNKDYFAIVVRGTHGTTDVLTDLASIGDGFTNAGLTTEKRFLDYLNNLKSLAGDFSNSKIFVTGHSLGGATAGCVTHFLNMDKELSSSNIYAYTFAAPKNCLMPIPQSDKNIHNVLCPDDIVPKVPPTYFSHYGREWIVTNEDSYEFLKIYEDLVGKAYNVEGYKEVPFFGGISPYWGAYHSIDTYLAHILYDNRIAKKKSFLLGIECPVDVEIYDSNGNIVGRIVNNTVDDSISMDNVYLYVDGDHKYVGINGNPAEYTIKLTGTDNGTMKYYVESIDLTNCEVVAEKTFANVTLEKGKTMTSILYVDNEADDVKTKNDTNKVSLLVLGDNGEPIREVLSDGNGTEIPISYEYTHTISFDANGGVSSATKLTTNTDGKLNSLPTASRTDYTFDGWFTEAENGEKITTDTVFTENTTVYAHWTNSGNSSGSTGGSSSGSTDGASSGSTGGTSSGSTGNTSSGTTGGASSSTTGGSSSNSTSYDETSSSYPDGTSTDSNGDTSSDSNNSSSSDGMPSTSNGISDSDSFSASGESSKNSNGSSDDNPGNPSDNPPTGVSVVIIPLLFAAGASIVIFHKKSKK